MHLSLIIWWCVSVYAMEVKPLVSIRCLWYSTKLKHNTLSCGSSLKSLLQSLWKRKQLINKDRKCLPFLNIERRKVRWAIQKPKRAKAGQTVLSIQWNVKWLTQCLPSPYLWLFRPQPHIFLFIELPNCPHDTVRKIAPSRNRTRVRKHYEVAKHLANAITEKR